ncbi:MAG TPA: adenosine deaminase [Candidatus Acidoferrales bacterium]|nr:adenosine deaminase [Candidatus Acidoferrales bacterium]
MDQRGQTTAAAALIARVTPPTSPADTIRAWPKAELHLHLEGSIEPETAVALAERYGQRLALEEVVARYSYADFPGFLEAFKWVTTLLREPRDYALIAERLVAKLRSQNVVYAEITLSVGVMLLRKQDVAANFSALRAAAEKAAGSALRLQWVFDAARQFGVEQAMEVAWLAVGHRREGVVAFGMGGDELAVPAEKFRSAYDFARSHGLHALVHAGEVGGADEVRRVVEILGAERVGHGIAAIQDPAVVEFLAERRVPLEVCPTSNLRTGALSKLTGRPAAGPAKLSEHPVAELFRAGVLVTLSTDDPAMFQTNLIREYEAGAAAGLRISELASIAQASFEAAFLPEPERDALLARFRELLRVQGLVY